MIEITSKTIRTSELIDYVKEGGAGAINVFIGTTRNQTAGKKVIKLDFEAYEPMAVKELQKIADRAVEQWDILSYAIVHRVGILEIGEEAVVIAVSTPHRKDAFQACEFIIDELKKTVPIWKREVFEDGDVWVAAHP
ncbi:molybdenum cofactor biosynthesis protein MoaE [Reichenbachiella agariperforans]|uniref:molybdenum cofactor biosynthesis protein MoaE n=1 Tax=Reichenbachiella agariperforans TaxID=156994 RepID=UPI001C083C99|nr:molybdenum cofactor biosynthesis protein MoaE [Reichenbachiella agariperforans]MBU2913684.1 molybdenum cofactor biosynthesis protein MoaE [Reichenbachiella agariperforans]